MHRGHDFPCVISPHRADFCFFSVCLVMRVCQSLLGADLRGTGVCDLVVTSMHSVDVLSWEADSGAAMLHAKLECIDDIQQLEEALRNMQSQQTQTQEA